MWIFILIVYIASFCQVSGAEGQLQQLLGITDRELHERFQLVSKIEKLEFWHVLTTVQQERLRHAIILGRKPPNDWTRFRTYDSIVKSENADYLKKLTYFEPLERDFLMNALPEIAHEDSVKTASGKSWWKELSSEEKMELSRLVLSQRGTPYGWRSWGEAINDSKFGEWIRFNKNRLKFFGKVPGSLQEVLGITDSELQERLGLLSRIQRLQIWNVLTGIQQERLRQAVILNKTAPPMWIRLDSYDKLLKPENENFLWRLTHVETRLRNFFMNRLPSVPHEDVVQTASTKRWWTNLTTEEQKELSLLILREMKVPSGWESWREAVKDENFGRWITKNKDRVLG